MLRILRGLPAIYIYLPLKKSTFYNGIKKGRAKIAKSKIYIFLKV
jgi:hypothetical protein